MSGTFDRARFPNRRGFTLVELLVVVSIIALLVSILLPTLGKARAAAKLVLCQANMHAIGRAAFMYAADNNLCVPRDASWTASVNWNPDQGLYFYGSRFSPYMGGPEIPLNMDVERTYVDPIFENIKAYRCPSFKDPDNVYMLTYVTNGWNFTNPNLDETPAYPISNMNRSPAEVGYIMEFDRGGFDNFLSAGGWPYLYGIYDCLGFVDTDGSIYNDHLPYDEDGSTNDYFFARMIQADSELHRGQTTLIFFDGHAESRWLRPDDLPLDMFFIAP